MSDQTGLSEWRCASCGEVHDDLPAPTYEAPYIWHCASDEEREAEFELTTDTCIWKDEHFFIHGTLLLPLKDLEGTFNFGIWSTLSRECFFRYMDEFDSPGRIQLGPMFGWFSSYVSGYPDTVNLKCNVYPQEPGLRPIIELQPSDHPLSIQQREGIRFEEAVAYCHETLGL